MDSTTWALIALLIAVIGCLVNIVILIRRVNRLESMALRQIKINANLDRWQVNQECRLDQIRSRTNRVLDGIEIFASEEKEAIDDITILLSGIKAYCFGRKANTDKKFAESLHRINERVRDLNNERVRDLNIEEKREDY